MIPQPPPVRKEHQNMADSVSFKAYLKRDGQEVEVRRFGIDGGAATSYVYLRGKIQSMFPSVQNDQFVIFWQDTDNDYITVSSDEELIVALTTSATQPIKLYIHIKPNEPQGSQQSQHPGVSCDGCDSAVVGYRYKCVTCPDFDLCTKCEASGKHPEHFMLRMPSPMTSHPKLFRKLFGRPHKFNRRHGWDRFGMHGETLCSFSQRDNAAAAGMPDMFDFSGLMELINSLRVATPAGNDETVASAQATSSSQTQASSSQTQASSSQTQADSSQKPQQNSTQSQTAPNPNTYLTNIGQAIAAFLDPFGVDVTFDVRSNAARTQEPPAASAENSQPHNSNAASSTQQGPAAPPPSTSPNTESAPPTPAPVSPPTPVSPPAQPEPVRDASPTPGDWTFLNRESPVRGEVAMDVDESRGARPKTAVYPELPRETPSAPPQAEYTFTDLERQRIQDAMDKINSMGFNFDTTLLRDLLRQENCNIASVLELILSNPGKK